MAGSKLFKKCFHRYSNSDQILTNLGCRKESIWVLNLSTRLFPKGIPSSIINSCGLLGSILDETHMHTVTLKAQRCHLLK